jgi:hypothetical protein
MGSAFYSNELLFYLCPRVESKSHPSENLTAYSCSFSVIVVNVWLINGLLFCDQATNMPRPGLQFVIKG